VVSIANHNSENKLLPNFELFFTNLAFYLTLVPLIPLFAMKKFYTLFSTLVLLIFASSLCLQAQNEIPPSVASNISTDQVETLYKPHDKYNEVNKANQKSGQPLWAGFSILTEVKPHTMGTKVNWKSGATSWMLRATSPGAPALALVFEDVSIPKDATLYVYSESNPSASYSIKGSDLNSKYISTPPLPGDAIIVEYYEPAQIVNTMSIMSTFVNSESTNQLPSQHTEMVGSFVLTDLVVIYTGLEAFNSEKGLGDSGACMVNINCSPEGDNWQVIKRGVARILLREGSGWYWCSGTLINNTNQDGTPYFLTADHCGDASTTADMNVWQFFFNYERPGCSNITNPPTNMITGCSLRSKGVLAGGSDFKLVQLNSTPQQSWNPYYNGWDRAATAATGGVSIHHPSGDAKKISTYTGTLYSATPNIEGSVMASGSAWGVVWIATDNGHSVTEGGSSGSPIFNSDGKVVGTLSGGSSFCSSPNAPDFYGKFSYHWTSNGTLDSQKLQPWLDPGNTGVTSLSGYDPFAGLQVNFAASKLVVDKDEEITFTDQSSGGEITSWSWNFGESAVPATATGQGPHTVYYTSHGYKTVSLTVNNQHTVTKTNYIYVNESMMITQSTSQTILAGNTVACGSNNINSDNSYFRVFHLSNDHSITEDWEIRIVDVGVEVADGNEDDGTPITIRLHTASSTDLTSATLTQLYEESFVVPDVTRVVRQFLLATPVLIPAGSIVAVEVFTPSGQNAGHRIYLGSNSDGQNSPTYILASACGITTITDLVSISFPNVHLVINLWGDVPNEPPFSVTYLANNALATGDGPVDTNEYMPDDEVTILGQGTLALAGHTFGGWNTQANGQGTTYQPAGTFNMPESDVSLYAVWQTDNTSVNEIQYQEISVFPNPTNSFVTVSSNLGIINKIEVFDITGRSVYNNDVSTKSIQLDVSSLEKGIYLIRIETELGLAVKKLQVQR
jgi:PKD repeat protein